MTISPLLKKKVKEEIISSLIEEYYSLFRTEKKNVSRKNLLSLANCAFEDAVTSFEKLKPPKICNNLTAYSLYWLREEFNIFFQTKTLKKVSLRKTGDKEDQHLKAISNFFSILPIERLASMGRQLFGTSSFEKRKKIYKQYKPRFDKLKKPFTDVVKSRNIFAKERKYLDFIALIRQKDQIPKKEYCFFLENIDQLTNHLNSNLPKVKNLPDWFYNRLNQPCLLCLVPFKDLAVPEEVLNFVTKLYPQIKLFLPKIRLLYEEKARMRYIKEQDIFKVSIRKSVNQRHQMIDLVHELGHVVYFVESFADNKDLLKSGKYVAEKAAIQISLKVLNSINPKVMQAYYGDLLPVIHRSLFELAIYKEPKQNYDFLYARLFNKCFPRASQRSNPLYLLDEDIAAKPLTSLSSAVASANLILENKNF